MIDAVYIVGTGSNWNDGELRYSLRSLEMFVTGIRNIYIVGHKPRWMNNENFIPFGDHFKCKERNIMLKMAAVCGLPQLSENFLHIHDDHFCLAPCEAENIPNYAGGSLARLFGGIKKNNHWRDAVLNSYNALQKNGLPVKNYDLHFPMIINKTIFPEIMDRYPWKDEQRGFVVKSLYGNTAGILPTPAVDLKINERYSMDEVVRRLQGRTWFSVGNGGLTFKFKGLLENLYPHPTRFESR